MTAQPNNTQALGITDSAVVNRNDAIPSQTAGLWKIPVIIIAMMPLLQAIATWDDDGQFTIFAHYVRQYSLPVTILELVVLLLCATIGWRPHRQFLALQRPTQLLAVLAAVSVFVSSVVNLESSIIPMLFAFRYAAHILLLGALVHVLKRAQTDLSTRYWLWAMVCGAIAYILALSVFSVFVPKPDDFKWFERIPSATNIRQIGSVVVVLAMAPATLLFFEKRKADSVLAWASLTCLLAFLMWTGSRGALLGFCIGAAVAMWRNWVAITPSRKFSLFWSILAAIAVSVLIPAPDPSFGIFRMVETVASSDVSSGRLEIWKNSVGAIMDAPLFGYGAGTYRQNMTLLNGFPFNHPHNFVLQFVYDWGVLGGSIMVVLLGTLGTKLMKPFTSKPDAHFLATASFVTITTTALIDGPLFFPMPIVIAVALIAPHLANLSFRQFKPDYQ
jgi:O-antigen ligase